MLETYTYPSGFALKYVHNSRGFMSQVRRLDNNNLLWEATEQNQRGQHTDIMFGNGDNISKEFDQYGFPSRYSFYNKAAGGENKANIRNYRFNSATGNLMSQTDHLSGQWESYAYDQQLHNRLFSWSINGTHTSSIDYSNAGNITRKTDVSSQADSYVYNPWNKPHAVVQIDEPQDGFVAQAKEQTIDYTAFNKAETITQAFYAPSVDRHRLRFTYGTDQQRRKMDYYFVGVNGMEIFRSSTFYLDDFERVIDTDISDIHYLSGPTGLFGILTIEDNTETMHYVHTDYLGSYTYITDEDGQLAEVLSYDPWGRRRNAYDWTNYNVAPTLFDRGYTGHEHLDQFGLINMNGRVYDPFLARFLSPDPFVQAPEYSQNYNRYSYAWNNPLKYTDPSGEFIHLIIGAAIGGIANWIANGVLINNLPILSHHHSPHPALIFLQQLKKAVGLRSIKIMLGLHTQRKSQQYDQA
ncbi:MAG: hypothetical protein PHX54_12995 [Lentimicrobiaceae bacterium]|nr:hypothetical protein [Lentimicrobiaceae bacterium]